MNVEWSEPGFPSPHPFPFSQEEKGRLEPPLSAQERGGGEGLNVPAHIRADERPTRCSVSGSGCPRYA